MTPIRTQIVDRVQHLLSQITVSNGYCTNAGQNVSRRQKPQNIAPYIAVFDGEATYTRNTYRKQEVALEIAIELAACGDLADMDHIEEDIIRAMAADDPTLNNLIERIELDSTEPVENNEQNTAVGVIANYTITFKKEG